MTEEARVELDIFSGRPNPTWSLSAADTAILNGKLAALPPATPSPLANPLGYRGFIVRLKQATVTVQNGTVWTKRGSELAHHRDPDRAVERWLLNTGRPFLDDEVFTVVNRELPD
ncbi:hypothetical protein LWC34_06160 [Kibdelosporangium philippinense]|uniref:Uncharacterized protein n=1 Tax=Kibdelosporangium philippinense TaxID=211113 RepID=A0ABS8Z4L2_9PSEU|nr:hypothetical protein [Kibdelosporangium philippinense]MCE7002417.1 hypothetical protein [Kibdelosporangium philippinense]